MSAPPPKPPKPSKPGVPTTTGTKPATPTLPQRPLKPPVQIPAGRSFRQRPQSQRVVGTAIPSTGLDALIDKPLPTIPPNRTPALNLPQLPPKKPTITQNQANVETPPHTPKSSRTPMEPPSGRALPKPMPTLPKPVASLPEPSKTPPVLPTKPKPVVPPARPKVTLPQQETTTSTTSSINSSSKRVSVRNPGLENVLSLRLSSGQSSSSNLQGPPPSAPPAPPETSSGDKDKKKSKLLRPVKKAAKNKNKPSQMFGTLPRLMGKDTSKDKKESTAEPPPLESSSSAISFTKRQSVSNALESASHHDSSNGSSHSSNTNNNTDDSSTTKWKRGAEAEAILKLISESKDISNTGTNSGNAPITAPPEALDAEAIMKILGLEEPGIKLPKHNEGGEKALDPISELQLTERNFIADLGLLNETFVKPVRSNNILSSSIIEAISINLERLISLHRELYKNFLTDSSLLGIATTFSDSLITELERLYTVYMGHYESSLALFHEKRDSLSQFRKYLKQREEITDKSVPNLLVTPVQRVCKYELMLAQIKKTVLKNSPDKNDLKLQEHADLLQKKIDQLNVALQNVDRRRAAADNWDKINQLEKGLLLSESLSKVGRVILLTTETTVRVGDEEKMFKLVLFNDQLIRTKISKKSRARLLDSIPLNQLQIINITQDHHSNLQNNFANSSSSTSKPSSSSSSSGDSSERFSFYIIPTDPRIPIWTVHFNSENTKNQWMESLSSRVLSFERFCESWGIRKSSNECLIAADGARWPQEYVNDCRLFITSNHLCILWKMFGIEERELVPLHVLTHVQQTTFGKEKALRINATNWKQDYTFTSLQLLDHTEPVLSQLIQKLSSSPQRLKVSRSETICHTNNPFLLSPIEWNSVWADAQTISFQPNEVIIDDKQTHNFLYQLLSGEVIIKATPPIHISAKGSIFGATNFFEESSPNFQTCSGTSPTTVLQLKRDSLVASCDANYLMKFFATLAKNLAPA